jgi:ABC-type uncharacterized transport system substrate-binding protein
MCVRKGVFLLILFFLYASFISLRAEQSSSIPILVSSNNGLYLSVLHNLQLSLKAKLELHYLTGMKDSEISDFLSQIQKDSPPFVIGLGNSAALLLKERLKNIPMLFSMVNAPKSKGLEVESLSCGVNTDVPIAEFFRILKEIKPEIRKVNAFYSNASGEFILREGDYSASQFGLILEKAKLAPQEDIEAALQSIRGLEAIYIIPDPLFTVEKFEAISKYAKENRLILFTQIPFLVNAGTTFSITPYFARAGNLVGEMGNDILSGKLVCKDGLAYSIKEFFFNINRTFAEESQIYIPSNLYKRANNNKILLEGIKFFEKGNYEISNLVMDKILQNDPANSTALYYKSLLNEKIHGEKMAELITKAKAAQAQNNYRLEREYYNKLLKLEPDNEEFKNKIQESFQEESEKERREGEILESKNQSILAIQKYLQSIKIYDKNAKTRANLESIRNKERVKIPKYFNHAKNQYDARNYEEAIALFKNILLIDSNHKNSIEYLRLSEEKRVAMEKFKECMRLKNKNCYLLWEK